MSLVQPIARQIIHTTWMHALSLVARFLLIWCLGKTFLPDEYGAYAIIGTVLSIGIYLFGLNLYVYMTRQAPGKTVTEGMSILKTLLAFEMTLGLAAVMIVIGSGLDRIILRQFQLASFVTEFRLAALLLLLDLIKMEILRYHNAVKRIEVANVMQFLAWSLWVLPVVGLWALGWPLKLSGVLLAWILGTVAGIAYGLGRLEIRTLLLVPFDRRLLRPALAFSLPTLLVSIGHSIIFLSDRWLLAFFAGVDVVGRYAYAFSLMNIFYLLASAVMVNVLLPYAVEAENRGERQRRNELLTAMLKYGVLGLGIGVAVLIIHDHEIVTLMTRLEYEGAAELLPWLAPVPFLLAVMSAPYNLLYLNNQTLRLSCFYGIGMVANVTLNFLLIPSFGGIGAAMGTVLALAVITGLLYRATWSEAAIDWRSSKISEMMLAVCVVLAVGWGLKGWVLPQAGLAWLGSMAAMVILYVILNVAFGVLGRREWQLLVASSVVPLEERSRTKVTPSGVGSV